jgi:hypothetical protein
MLHAMWLEELYRGRVMYLDVIGMRTPHCPTFDQRTCIYLRYLPVVELNRSANEGIKAQE